MRMSVLVWGVLLCPIVSSKRHTEDSEGRPPIVANDMDSIPIVANDMGSNPIVANDMDSIPIVANDMGSNPIVAKDMDSNPVIGVDNPTLIDKNTPIKMKLQVKRSEVVTVTENGKCPTFFKSTMSLCGGASGIDKICVFDRIRCNGINDSYACNGTGDDEVDCENYACPNLKGYQTKKCSDNIKCLGENAMCDSVVNCVDKSDENACDKYVCPAGFTKCGGSSGVCVDVMYRCNGDKEGYVCGSTFDDVNGDDEKDCDKYSCPKGMVKCGGTSGACINDKWRCNGRVDGGQCGGKGDDEADCGAHACKSKSSKCNNGRCVLDRFFCDGEDHCRDQTDETGCDEKDKTTLSPKVDNGTGARVDVNTLILAGVAGLLLCRWRPFQSLL